MLSPAWLITAEMLCLGILLSPTRAAAQACTGIPLADEHSTVTAGVAFSGDSRMYAAGYTRDLTDLLAFRADYARTSFDFSALDAAGRPITRTGKGHLISTSVVYDFASLNLPICSIGGLGYLSSGAETTNYRSRQSGLLALYAMGLGHTFPLGVSTSLTPFAVAQAHLARICRNCPQSEAQEILLYGQAEGGLTLTLERLFFMAAYRRFLGENPLLRPNWYGGSTSSMTSFGVGVTF